MSKKRGPRPKDGILEVGYGVLDGEEDILFVSGDLPCTGARRMLYSLMSSKNYNPISKKFEKSFIETLESWGFDITTIKFQITHKEYSKNE